MSGYLGGGAPKADQPIQMGSDRTFGLVFAAVFGLVGLYPLLHDEPIRLWALAVAAAFLTIALVYARLLRPLNRIWFLIGMAMHKVISPIILGLLYFVTVTPIGLLMRLSGHDPLRLKRSAAITYWISRQPPGPAPESLKNQF